MTKREFLKASGALLTGSACSQFIAGPLEGDTSQTQPGEVRKNWAGNYQYTADHLYAPESIAELQQIVKKCPTLKALGARHSFNGIADSPVNQVSLKNFQGMTIDAKARTVTVGAGVTYGAVSPYLEQHGFAVHNLASLPHISIAGARATATHGSGIHNGNLSTAVTGLEFVTASGDVATLSRERDGDQFCGAVVDLGGLGVVTKVTLALQPAYDVQQVVFENLPMEQLESHLEEIFSSGYSVSLFTDWQNHRITQVWIKSRVTSGKIRQFPADFFGAKLATRNLHPLAGHSAENCTEQLGIPGPWYERLPHFRMNFTPSSGEELQTEYFVPRTHGYPAILAVERLREQIAPHLFISELRTIDADDLWMSPCFQQPSMTIHFTWKPEWPEVQKILPLIEAQLEPFHAKPHWAKLFTVSPEKLQAGYEKLPAFRSLLQHYDPEAKFRNRFLTANLYTA